MSTPIKATICLLWMIGLALTTDAFAETSSRGTIYGVVKDSETGQPLAGAHVMVNGTNIGRATDVDGRFRLTRVPEGTQTLTVRYVSYDSKEVEIEIEAGESTDREIALTFDSLMMDDITIEARAPGQTTAFNNMRNSPNIVNIVSSEQIDKFPDANVSDALRRVPGISTYEFRGEASEMFVRGMAPGLNTVTMDGERLPTTGSTNRDVSLLGLSSDMVGAIEVSKAITPDMDADAVGGNVNLETNRPVGNERIASAVLSGGWHQFGESPNGKLGLHYGESMGDFSYMLRGNISTENRVMDDVRHFWGDAEFDGQTHDVLDQLRVGAYELNTNRYSLSGRADYRINNDHSVFVRGMYNLRDKEGTRHQYRMRPDNGEHISPNEALGVRVEPIGRRNKRQTTLSTVTLGGESNLGDLTMDYGATYAYGQYDSPYQEYLRWRNNDVDVQYDISNRNFASFEPINGTADIVSNPSDFFLSRYENRVDDSIDRDINLRLNFNLPYDIGSGSGNFKFGGRAFQKNKERNHAVYVHDIFERDFWFDEVSSSDAYRELTGGYNIQNIVEWGPGETFRDAHMDEFGLDVDRYRRVSDPEDYVASERVLAGYAMSTFDYGNWMFLAGLRTEYTGTTYQGQRSIFDDEGSYVETTDIESSGDYLNFFPMAHIRYALGDRSNIRLAWTNSIARPEFTELAPYEYINYDAQMIRKGNPDLTASTVMNLDLMAEHYFSSTGVLSGGLFYKNMNDFIFENISTQESCEFEGFQVLQPMNGTGADVWGAEIAWQQRLFFLPGFLSNLGVYTNYTYSGSNAQLRIDREVSLPRQIPHVVNAALSYETGGFSAMLSLNYQSTYLYNISTSQVSEHRSHLFPTMDRYMQGQERIDFSISQEIGNGLQIFGEAKNLTNSPQLWYDGNPDFHYRSSYNHIGGWIGIRYNR